MKKLIYICYIVLMLSLSGCEGSQTTISEDFMQESVTYNDSSSIEETSVAQIYVYICGQVKKPGVYELPLGSRVCDVIDISGGTLKKAALDNLNLAALVSDGEKIYVSSKDELITISSEAVKDDRININTASKEELMTLTGIGEAKAEAIISYREECGGFMTIEDIMNISGIKQSVFDKIKDLIIVG